MAQDVLEAALDALAPKQSIDLDWTDVLSRADRVRAAPAFSTPRRRPKKRWLIALAVAGAMVIPLSAVGAVGEWWFSKSMNPPASSPEVLSSGTWAGAAWKLVGYGAVDGRLCYSVIPAGASQASDVRTALGCGGSPEGHPRGSDGQGGMGFLRGFTEGLPAYITGPVIESADEVSVHLSTGETIRTPTFGVSQSLGPVEFYATPVPADAKIVTLTARSADGQVVACSDLIGDGSCSKL